MNLEFFDSLGLKPPKEKIYLRLGYSKGKTKLSEEELAKFESYVDFALDKINLEGAAATLAIKEITEDKIFIEGGLSVESNSLSNFLKNCRQILFMGVTAGRDIMKVISAKEGKQKLDKAVVADAVASEMVDAGLGWIADYKARFLRQQNKVITDQRFSAGYGDFDLSYQKMIYKILNLAKLGVKLNKSYILEPEKTVTAVCGIK